MTNSTFIFRIARVEGQKGKKATSVDMTGREAQQLVLGEYYNSRLDKRKGGARLHWGQHHFLKGMFYIYKFADGSFTSSFNKDKMLESHVDISINFEEEDIVNLRAQLKTLEDVLCKPPVDELGVSSLQDQYQLHVEVKEDAVAEVSEFLSDKSGQKDRLTIRVNRMDIVSFKVVKSGDEEFKASVGGVRIKLDTVMEGLFGKPGSDLGAISTVEGVRERFITQSTSKRRRNRKKKQKGANADTSNQVVADSTKLKQQAIVVETEEEDDIPL